MALSEVIIWDPATFDTTGGRPILSPTGVVWTWNANGASDDNPEIIPVNLNTQTELSDITGINAWPVVVKPSNDDVYADDFIQLSFTNFIWRFTTAGDIFKYDTGAGGDYSDAPGCIDSNGNVWMSDAFASSIYRFTNFSDATYPSVGTVTRTVFTPSPLASAYIIGNGGAISGRVYYRTFDGTTSGTRGIAYVKLSDNSKTKIYSAPGRIQPWAAIDPTGSYIISVDCQTTTPITFTTMRKLDLDGNELASVDVSSVMNGLRNIASMMIDRAGNLWVDASGPGTVGILLFSAVDLSFVEILLNTHAMLWHFDYVENSCLTYQPAFASVDFKIYQIEGPGGDVVVTTQPMIFVST